MNSEHKLKHHAKNSFFIILSRVMQILTGIVVVIILTRYLSVEDFGCFAYIFTFVTIVVNMTHLGVNQVLVREISNDKSNAAIHFGSSIYLRLFTVLISVLVVVVAQPFLGIPEALISALYICLIAEITNSAVQLFSGIFLAYEQTLYDPLLTILQNVVYLVLLISFVLFGQDLSWIFGARGASFFIEMNAMLYIICKKFVVPRFFCNLKSILHMGRASLSLGIGCLLYQNIFFANTLFLKWLSGPVAVPFFQLSNDLMLKVFIFPAAILQTVFPAMSRAIYSDEDRGLALQQTLVNYAVLLGVPVILYLSFYSSEIVSLLFGAKFIDARYTLIILSFVIVPMSIDGILNFTVLAMNKQYLMIYYAGVAMIFIVIANIIFVHTFGYIASSLIALATYFLLAFSVAYVVKRLGVDLKYTRITIKCSLAGLASLAVMYYSSHISIFLPIITGVSSYFLFSLLIRSLPLSDFREIINILRRHRPDVELKPLS